MEEKKCIQIFFRLYEGNHNTFEDLEVDVRLTVKWISQRILCRYGHLLFQSRDQWWHILKKANESSSSIRYYMFL